jgi:hypothetical protein
LDNHAKIHFIGCYTRIVGHAWSSEVFCASLAEDPRAVLAACGIDVPRDADVVVRRRGDDVDLPRQIALWEVGEASGRYVFDLPTPGP